MKLAKVYMDNLEAIKTKGAQPQHKRLLERFELKVIDLRMSINDGLEEEWAANEYSLFARKLLAE